jgi:hypothetical protein
MQAPHLVQSSASIWWGFFFSPLMAPAGQIFLQAPHPVQASGDME